MKLLVALAVALAIAQLVFALYTPVHTLHWRSLTPTDTLPPKVWVSRA